MNCQTQAILQKLDGKNIKFEKITLFCEDNELMLHADILCENEIFSLLFSHVTSLSLKAGTHHFELDGFSFCEKKKDGYEADVRYYIEDYEQDTLSFYCRDVEALTIT